MKVGNYTRIMTSSRLLKSVDDDNLMWNVQETNCKISNKRSTTVL